MRPRRVKRGLRAGARAALWLAVLSSVACPAGATPGVDEMAGWFRECVVPLCEARPRAALRCFRRSAESEWLPGWGVRGEFRRGEAEALRRLGRTREAIEVLEGFLEGYEAAREEDPILFRRVSPHSTPNLRLLHEKLAELWLSLDPDEPSRDPGEEGRSRVEVHRARAASVPEAATDDPHHSPLAFEGLDCEDPDRVRREWTRIEGHRIKTLYLDDDEVDRWTFEDR